MSTKYRSQTGQATVGYVLLLALILIVAAAAVSNLSQGTNQMINKATQHIERVDR